MLVALSVAAAISAILAIAADRSERRHRGYYVLKPLTTILIIGVAALGEPSSQAYQYWILGALALSLSGDVCLMFEGNRWFLGGLASFLLAHLAFVAAFLSGLDAIEPPLWSYVSLAYGAVLLYLLLPRAGSLKIPVALYGAVLAAMVIAAAARHAALPSTASLFAVAGAVLFMASDSFLGWRKFAGNYPGAQLYILSTYWLSIWLIARSVG